MTLQPFRISFWLAPVMRSGRTRCTVSLSRRSPFRAASGGRLTGTYQPGSSRASTCRRSHQRWMEPAAPNVNCAGVLGSSRPRIKSARTMRCHAGGPRNTASARTPVGGSWSQFGSPGWTRTINRPINSRVLCQLSYRGSGVLPQCAEAAVGGTEAGPARPAVRPHTHHRKAVTCANRSRTAVAGVHGLYRLSDCTLGGVSRWWPRLDLNQRLPRYQRGALPTELLDLVLFSNVPPQGLEP